MRVIHQKSRNQNGLIQSERKKFEQFILESDHPCLMAQTVFKSNNLILKEYGELGDEEHAEELLLDLNEYVARYNFETNDFYTFIAVFHGQQDFSEKEFEKRLWQELQNLHTVDPHNWDQAVSDDPESEHFSFSLCGKAFYVVGMHPNSSRLARQSPKVTMVFNLHWQFEKLREMGAYDTIRDKIRDRDKALQGSNNPMLENFGAKSEARQYSGRAVSDSWKCPFHKRS